MYLIQFPIINGHLYLGGVWLGVNEIPKRHMLKGDWTTCSEFVNHPRCKSQHNLGGLYDHLFTERTITLKIHKMFICAPNIIMILFGAYYRIL
jgi:hypothetical protein